MTFLKTPLEKTQIVYSVRGVRFNLSLFHVSIVSLELEEYHSHLPLLWKEKSMQNERSNSNSNVTLEHRYVYLLQKKMSSRIHSRSC